MSTQSLQALDVANAVRLDGADWRREVYSLPAAPGRVRLAEALEATATPRALASMRVEHFLRAARSLGADGVRRMAAMCLTRSLTALRVGELTPRERKAIAAELRRL